MAGNALLQQFTIASDVVLARPVAIISRDVEVPILGNLWLATLVQGQDMAGQQFANPGIHAVRAADVAERKIFRQRLAVELRLHSGMGEDGFYFRSEQQCLAVVVIVERLDSQPVSRNEEAPSGPVPNRERKHATEVLNAVLSILLIQMDNGFSIAPGAIAVPARLQVFA